MEVQITFNNSMLVAKGIDYTCPAFKELVKACLDSNYSYSRAPYLWAPVIILDEESDGRSASTMTTPTTAEQTSTNKDSIVTAETTNRGDGGELVFNIGIYDAIVFSDICYDCC
ncbi:hypothetical protein P879_09630 [Paragonimus westermani]|uniref:Uncharacterized protein n=1 Tax=Paragonimus westermani TaxID=34504 RepID=A0A8T0DLL4_9TREM|nr:hypothetical protein P879_09630 [Paragonimus westermani]